jgi:predicted nuclease of predicted toxin-antitoxin system
VKLLLDECVDQRLRADLPDHEVKTVPEMGWSNYRNGDLLDAAQHEFDVLITVDRRLPYQQHLPRFDIAVVILHARTNRLADLRPLVPRLKSALPTAPVGEATVIGS